MHSVEITPAARKVRAELKIRLGWDMAFGAPWRGRCLGVFTSHPLTTQPPACQGHQLTCLWWHWGVWATWKSQSLQCWPMESAQETEHRKSFIPWHLQGNHLLRGHWEGGLKRRKIFLFKKCFILVFLSSLFLLNCLSFLLFKGNLLHEHVF